MSDTATIETAVHPALYVGTYAKYNDGSIAGKWLTLRDYPDAGAFLAACRELHADEADPELMFQDFEGFPKELYSEAMSLEDARKLYEWVNLADDDRELLTEYMDATGYNLDGLDVEDVRDKLYCVLDSYTGLSNDVAMGLYVIEEGLFDVPEHVRGYIDVEALGRDWLMDLYVSGNGWVFEG